MKNKIVSKNYSIWQVVTLTFLRILIGWHFLYEGLAKLLDSTWSSQAYLVNSTGPFSPFFKSLATSESLMIVDILNEWGLILIGLGLFLGFLSKPAKIFGVILLFLYYITYPPIAGTGVELYVQGNYWIVNDQLIEIGALLVLFVFPTSYITGLDRFLFYKKKNQLHPKTIND